jgi:hypothetical protein
MALAADGAGTCCSCSALTCVTVNGTLARSVAPAVPVTTRSSRMMAVAAIWKFWVRLAPGDRVSVRATVPRPWRAAVI